MPSFEVLRNHEGLRLLAHADTLREMHSIVHAVNARSPLIVDKEGFFLSLAYGVRKAYEGQIPHRIRPVLSCMESIFYGRRFWCSAGSFRASLGFIDPGKRHQVYAYALEAVVEDGLKGFRLAL